MKRPRSRAGIFSILLIAALLFGGIVYAWNIAIDLFNPASQNASSSVNLEIKPGESTAEIADDLQQKGLIRNAMAFRIWARIKGLDTQLQAGLYKALTPNMSIMQITDRLLNGQPDAIPYTVIEGYRIEQIANVFSDGKLVKFKKADFLNYAKHPDQFPDKAKYPLLKYIPQGSGMEGLLFATTYEIPVQSTARDIVDLMLQTTTDLIQQNNLEQIAKQHQYANVYQMITLASIVERESGNQKIDYRPQIASVYWNRLYKGGSDTGVALLQADPTVQYARDTQTPPTTHYWEALNDDPNNIAPDSPYNTYNKQGYPPTPISSPGLASLKAAAAPADTNYYFFFTAKDGNDYFSIDLAGQSKLEAQYGVSGY